MRLRTVLFGAIFCALLSTHAYAQGDDRSTDRPLSSTMIDTIGAHWTDTFGAPLSYVTSAAVAGDDIYLGGNFIAIDTLPIAYIARWNQSQRRWYTLGSGLDGPVYDIKLIGSDLYVAGHFDHAGGIEAHNLAKWNAATGTWSALGEGTTGPVYALTTSGSRLYVGGRFARAGGIAAVNVAALDLSSGTWGALGSGLGVADTSTVHALALSGDMLYAGGQFGRPGSSDAHNIARWRAGAWEPLGTGSDNGVDGVVQSIALTGGIVWVGGFITRAGTVPASAVASWDGSTWRDVWRQSDGSIVSNRTAMKLLPVGDTLFVGGDGREITSLVAIDMTTGRRSQIDGAMGSVLPFEVGGDLIAVGAFVSTDSTVPFQGVARRRNGRWSNVAGMTSRTVDGWVNAVLLDDGDLYVGGDFYMVGSRVISNIARWSRTAHEWYPLGSGATGVVDQIIDCGDSLFVFGKGSPVESAGWSAYWNKRERRWDSATPLIKWEITKAAVVGGSPYFLGSSTIRYFEDGAWKELPTDDGMEVFTMTDLLEYNGNLVLTGVFFRSDSTGMRTYMATAWNGTQWTPLPEHALTWPVGACVHEGSLYLSAVDTIFRYDSGATAWHAIPFPSFSATTLVSGAGGVYIGGGDTANPYAVVLAMLSGDDIHILQSDIDAVNYPYAPMLHISADSASVAVAGNFKRLGNTVSSGVAIMAAPGIATYVAVDSFFIDFGTHPIGDRSERSFTITNADTSTGDIAGVLSLDTGAFEIVSGGGDFAIAPGGSHMVTARYLAPREGRDTADVSIVHNATNMGTMAVRLVGRTTGTTAVRTSSSAAPSLVVSPSPTRGETRLEYSLSHAGSCMVEILALDGRVLAVPVNRMLDAGEHVQIWDASALPSGVYIARLRAGEHKITTRFLVTR